MSEKSVFSVIYTGVAGHGSLPHKCVDPIVAAASFVSGIQTVVSRNTDPFKPVICTVNSINAGESDVAVPSDAVITGYIRSFDHDTHKHMEERVRRLAGSIAEAYECRCSTRITRMVPAVDNPDELYNICEQEVIIEVWISGFFLPCRISGPAGTVLSCFVQILYVSFIFPLCLKYLEKPAAQVSK
jgi:metal-dependent amidase/aminoacylase/carboxypeptidase family protein